MKRRRRGATINWKIIGGAVLAAVAAGVAMNYKALRRYIRINTM